LNGVVSKDHMHIEYPSSLRLSDLIKRFKGRSSRLLQRDYPELHKRYWGKHLWAIGYGAWSTGNITDKVVEEYLKHHKTSANDKDSFELE
jgi:putative transposase